MTDIDKALDLVITEAYKYLDMRTRTIEYGQLCEVVEKIRKEQKNDKRRSR